MTTPSYTILPGPMPTASDIEKGEKLQRNLDAHSIPVFSLERPPPPPPAVAAQSAVSHPAEGPPLSAPYSAPQQPMHSQEGAPHIQCPPMASRPSSRRMSMVGRCSRTAPVPDKPKIPSTPSVSHELRDAIAQVLKNSPHGILIGDLEKKLKEMTGVEINIEETGARSLEHLLVNFPEIVLMQYRGHGQLLLFDPGQTALKESIEQRRKDTLAATDVDCSGRGPEHQAAGQMYHDSRPKPNEYLPIYVSSVVSPGHFWFQIDGEQYGHLADLMEMLQSTYNHPQGCQYEMPPSLMKIGQLCAAKFPEDSNWYRGTIMGFKDSLVQIYYLDYGTTRIITKDLLRILRSQYLTLPAQAIRARLANVQPANGEWSGAAYTFFMERFTNKRLMALITSVTRDGLVSVSLTDTNGEKDVQLNDCLVVDGYAVFQVDDYAVGRPEVPASKKVDKSTSFSDLKSVEVKPSATGDADDAISITEQDIKFVQLPPNYGCHMVRISDKLYIISNEISAFLWEENVLRTMVRQKGYGYLPKIVLIIEDHLAVMEELAKFNIPGVFVNGEFAEILVLYELSIVIQILEIFEHKSDELKSELKKHLESFSANPSKWTKIQSLAATRSLAMQKKPRTAPMMQTGTVPASADIRRDSMAPVSQPSAGHHRSSSVSFPLGGVSQPGFAQIVRPSMEYGQQMDSLAQTLQQMTIRTQAPLTSQVGLLGLGYQLPTPPLHTPFGYSAAQILMQQQSYFAALQGLSSVVSNGAAFPQTPYNSSLLGMANLNYLAHAAPSASAMPRTTQQGPRQN